MSYDGLSSMISHVLCDLDGTILDTMELILLSFHYAFEVGLGQTVSDDELLLYFGQTLDDQFRQMRPDLSSSEIERLVEIYRTHNHLEHDRHIDLIPGADHALKILHHAGYPLGLVTSKRLDMAQHGLEMFDLWAYFSVVVHHDSTTQHKPRPDPILEALRMFSADPHTAVYVGDSPYDMQAAKSAGCQALGLAYNTFTVDDLVKAGADRVCTTWEAALHWIMEQND